MTPKLHCENCGHLAESSWPHIKSCPQHADHKRVLSAIVRRWVPVPHLTRQSARQRKRAKERSVQP